MLTSSATANTDQSRSKRVELIVRQLESLPTLPVVATRLLRATTSNQASVKEIVALIESDQSLTAKILSLSRKAYWGIGENVGTVEKAVLLMGFEAVRNAVLSIQVFEAFNGKSADKPSQERGFDRTEFWKHSLAVACAAQLLVEHIGGCRLDGDEVFVCGLLHDLGKVALDTCLPKSFERVVKIAEVNRVSIAEVERRILGMDHSAIGRRLAENWKLPDPILHAIWLHHHHSENLPENIGYRELINIINLADLIAREQRIGFSGNFAFTERSEPFARKLGLSAESYQKILLELRTRMGERASLIGLDELSSDELYQQALQAANLELGKLNQSLAISNRRLTTRAKYFDVINNLNRVVTPGMPSLQILEAIAHSARAALDVPAILAFRRDRQLKHVEVAFHDGRLTNSELVDLPFGEEIWQDDLAGSEMPTIDRLPSGLTTLVQRFGGPLAESEVRVVPLQLGNYMLGGLIFAAEDKTIHRLHQENTELRALALAFALALGQSEALEASNRVTEEWLAVNRQVQELQQRLLEARCMAALGEMASGAAHELNNPLAVVSGRGQLLYDRETDEEKKKALRVIVEQSHRASEIVSELLEFSRPINCNPATVELQQCLKAIVEGFCQGQQLDPNCVTVEILDGAEKVYADGEHLSAVIRELLSNAYDASGADAFRVRIVCQAAADHQQVQIEVRDSGPGMSPDVLTRAMDPFYSHRSAGRKRGMGLSKVYRYVQANGGTFWLESQQGSGTTAFIRLPVSAESCPAAVS